MRGRVRDAPVEAVAAHVHEPSAAAEIGFQRVQHLAGVVLRVAAGQHHRVALEEGRALHVEIVVGDDVVRLPLGLEPVEQAEVEEEVPEPARGPGVDDRAQPRDVADARAVRVRVVGRAAQLRVIHEQEVGGVHDRQRADIELGRTRPHARAVVRVGEVGRGGGQERHPGPGPAARRPHVEHHPEFRAPGRLEPERIDATARIVGNGQRQARGPARVVEVIVVKVNGPVLLRRAAPVHLATIPVVAGHRAFRRVHRPSVKQIRGPIDHSHRPYVGGEVPDGDRVGVGRARAPCRRCRLELGRGQGAA